MHPAILTGIYLCLVVAYTAGHWYIIEVAMVYIREAGHFWWSVARGVFTIAFAWCAYGLTWTAVAYCCFLLALFWLLFNPLLNWMRGKPWDHTNPDVFFDNFPFEDPILHLIWRLGLTLAAGLWWVYMV